MTAWENDALDALVKSILSAQRKGLTVWFGWNGEDEMFGFSVTGGPGYTLMKATEAALIMTRKKLEEYVNG